jgi:hypothetical protein
MEYYILGISTKWLFGALEVITHSNIDTVFSQEAILLTLCHVSKLDDYRIARVTSDLSSYNLLPRNSRVGYPTWTIVLGDVRTMAHTEFITVKEFVNQRVSVVARLQILLDLVDPTKWTKTDCLIACGSQASNILYCYQATCVTPEFQDDLVDMVMPYIANILTHTERINVFDAWLSKMKAVLQWLLKNVLKRKLFQYYRAFYSQPGFNPDHSIPVDHYDDMLRYDGYLIRFITVMAHRTIERLKIAVASNPRALIFLISTEKSPEITMIALKSCALISRQAFLDIVPYITCPPNKMIVDELYKAYHDEDEVRTIPTHVKSRLIEHAVEHGEICPISYEPLTHENTTVTPCGHLFSKESLAMTDQSSCPTCRADISL